MDQLKICSVEFDDGDPFLATFNVHLSRDMTAFERQMLPPLLTSGFSPRRLEAPRWWPSETRLSR